MSDDVSTISEKNLAISLSAFMIKYGKPRDKSHALSNMMLDIGVGLNIVFFTDSLNLKLFSEELLLTIVKVYSKVDVFLFPFNVKVRLNF